MSLRLPPLRSFALLAALFAASCSSSSAEGGELATPRSFEGFPADESVGIVQAEARFYLNYAELLDDYDVIDEERLVPIALRVGLRGAGMNEAQARIFTESGDMRLYLPDGTALLSRGYGSIEPSDEDERDALYGRAHKGGSLGNFDQASPGLVFFALGEGDEYEESTRSIVRSDGDVRRTLDLTRSVCSFRVTVGDESHTLYIGLKADRGAEAR